MTYFHIELDNKFNELFKQNRTFNKKDLIQLKSFIYNIYQKENSSETSGTPGYMAPEVMCAQNHTIAVDYFALGVLTFEFMMGVLEANSVPYRVGG